MAKLATHMSSILTDRVVESLARRKIFTFVDVLEAVPEELKSISGLSFKDILILRSDLISNCCPLHRSGLEVQSDLLSNSAIIPTGIEKLDNILGGGFHTGSFIEISGYSAVGKTQLCLAIAINAAEDLKQQVHWIDTKSDFSARHVYQRLESKNCGDEEIGFVMESIKVVKVNDFFELYSTLQHLQENFSTLHANIRIVIIDSLPAIFFNFMPDQKTDAISLLDSLVCKMKHIAREFHLLFILVNLSYKKLNEDLGNSSNMELNEASDVKIALGKYWSSVPSIRLYIEKFAGKSKKITIIRATNLPYGLSCVVDY